MAMILLENAQVSKVTIARKIIIHVLFLIPCHLKPFAAVHSDNILWFVSGSVQETRR